MASLVAKKKGNQLYYYVVESARVDGKPRIVHQTYLGSAEKVAALVKQRTAPLPLEATAIDFGLPGALWLAARQNGVLELFEALWPASKSGPSAAYYLLLAAIHRICQPGPKTEAGPWYERTILRSLWGFAPERFSSQEFWDCFDRIGEEQLEQAQVRLLEVWKQKQLVGRRLLAYDTTNFYTYIASTNARSDLAQRGHNKQGRHNLRQVGLSYVLDGGNGLSLCHHVYPGNVADAEELPQALTRMVALLDRNQIERDSVTLVLDKGSAALANTLALEQAGVGWISALPWNQAPEALRERGVEQLPACGSDQPGVRAAAEKMLVHGKEYLCVLKYRIRAKPRVGTGSLRSRDSHPLSSGLEPCTTGARVCRRITSRQPGGTARQQNKDSRVLNATSASCTKQERAWSRIALRRSSGTAAQRNGVMGELNSTSAACTPRVTA